MPAAATGRGGAAAGAVLLPAVALPATTVLSAVTGSVANTLRGLLVERVPAHVNLLLMEKASSLPDLACFENPLFYDDLQLIQREAAFRLMNLLDPLGHLAVNLAAGVSLLGLLGRLHSVIPVLLVTVVSPAAFVSFAAQPSSQPSPARAPRGR